MKKVLCCVMALCLMLLCGCATTQPEARKNVDLNALMGSMAADYGFGEGMLDLTQDDLLELYGIEAADVKQFAAKLTLDSIQADEVILIEAVDAQAAKRIKEKLDNRYQTKLNENRNYLPEQFAKIEKCSVTVHGNFVAMIVLENADEAAAAYEAAIK
jgi:hypothetical protein